MFAMRWLADGSRDTSLSTDGVASSPLPGWRVTVAGLGLAGNSPVLAGSMARLGDRRADGFSVRFGEGGAPPAPEPTLDRLVRCGGNAVSGDDVNGVVQAVTVAADELMPALPAPPEGPAPPVPVPPVPAPAPPGRSWGPALRRPVSSGERRQRSGFRPVVKGGMVEASRGRRPLRPDRPTTSGLSSVGGIAARKRPVHRAGSARGLSERRSASVIE